MQNIRWFFNPYIHDKQNQIVILLSSTYPAVIQHIECSLKTEGYKQWCSSKKKTGHTPNNIFWLIASSHRHFFPPKQVMTFFFAHHRFFKAGRRRILSKHRNDTQHFLTEKRKAVIHRMT